MTTDELREKKRQLRDDIQTLIETFEAQTGTVVRYVDVERVDIVNTTAGEPESLLNRVDVDVEV